LIKEFQPELIIVSCGFDSASEDPLGGFCLTEKFYCWAIKELSSYCTNIFMMLEGGYNVKRVKECGVKVIE